LEAKTYYYSETGVLTTLNDYAILDGSSEGREDGIHLVHNTTPVKKLMKLVSPSLTPVFVADLTANDNYVFYDDRFAFDNNIGNIDFSANYRVMQTFNVDFTVQPPVFSNNIIFFTASNFTKILEVALPLGTTQLVIHENGLFLFNPINLTVKHYNASGVETIYNQSMMYDFPFAQGVLISSQTTRTVHTFHKGILTATHTEKSVIPMSDNAQYGSSFILSAQDQTSFALYSVTLANGFTQDRVFLESNPTLRNYDLPSFFKYNSVSNKTIVGFYKHGWTVLEVVGEHNNGFNNFTTVEGVTYAIEFETTPTATANTFLVKAYDGRQGNDTVYTTTITGVDVLGVDFIGAVNEYVVLSLTDNVTLDGTSFVVDLLGETFTTLEEDIWYMDYPEITEVNDVIQMYSASGFVTIDLNDIQSGIAATTVPSLEGFDTLSAGYVSDFFGENDDLIYMARGEFPNPNNEYQVKFYRGDISLGAASFVLLATYVSSGNGIFQSKIAFIGDNIYAYDPWQPGSLVTILGDEAPVNYFVQGTALIGIDDELNETLIALDINAASTYLF
jgi:hypothetical protein